MISAIATLNVVRVVSLGAVSYLVLSLILAGDQKALAQSNLPPVTVDAPSQQRARPAPQRLQSSSSRGWGAAIATGQGAVPAMDFLVMLGGIACVLSAVTALRTREPATFDAGSFMQSAE